MKFIKREREKKITPSSSGQGGERLKSNLSKG